MQTLFRTLVLATLAASISACGLVYKPAVQQGNLLQKKTVDKLKIGMTKRQVAVLLGTPAITSPFNHDRWDYVNTMYMQGHKPTIHAMTLYFKLGALARIKGHYYGQNATKEQELLNQAKKYHVEEPTKGPRGDKNHNSGAPQPGGS
ncbi:outer membrane protein assembly factor BamE [Oleiagrimonas sp.]|jgi:outer membrane protein assembly factor BamE|uniref:outer membrane protein assembly factor BamE n=1 Tax=Oleiagrimonas sp. TaxID=2010330 RepID=UPI002618F9FD|nr:outer membrane protein assembly factor BamE [Oleiagrimonas sp.]MDA3914029.1 outer membrane protein assembly factor BamE [Oleiagrimonas sp.]